MIEIVKLIADVGGSLGLALFAIWMLDKNAKASTAQQEQQREELLAALERNTTAWTSAASAIAGVAQGIEVVRQAEVKNADRLSQMRAVLAQRPCVGGEVVGGE